MFKSLIHLLIFIGQCKSIVGADVFSTSDNNLKNTIVTELTEFPLYGMTYVVSNRDALKSREGASYFKNKDSIIKLQEESQVIYFDEDKEKWYLHQFDKPKDDEPSKKILFRVPISRCMDMTDGEGGLINPSVEFELSMDGNTGVSSGFVGVGQYSGDVIKAALGLSLSSSVKFTGSMVCNVKAGQYGQVFIRPYVYLVPKGKRVQVQHTKGKGLINKGKWEKTPSYNRYWIRPPMVECATGNDLGLCTGILPR